MATADEVKNILLGGDSDDDDEEGGVSAGINPQPSGSLSVNQPTGPVSASALPINMIGVPQAIHHAPQQPARGRGKNIKVIARNAGVNHNEPDSQEAEGLFAPPQPAKLTSSEQPPHQPSGPMETDRDPLRFSVSIGKNVPQQPLIQHEQQPSAPIQRVPQPTYLTQLLKDVCGMLKTEERAQFRSFVQKLKVQRDSGQIESLSRALLEQGPRIVGRDIWDQAIANRRRYEQLYQHPKNGGTVTSRQPFQLPQPEQQRSQLTEQRQLLQREAMYRQQHEDRLRQQQLLLEQQQQQQRLKQRQQQQQQQQQHLIQRQAAVLPPQAEDVEMTQSRTKGVKPSTTADDELASAPAGSLTEDLQKQHDLFRNSDLFDARDEESRMRSSMRPTGKTSTGHGVRADFLTTATCWHRLRIAVETKNTAKFASLRRKPIGDAPPLQPPLKSADCMACGALSRAAWLYLREALEALVVLSNRRSNDEAHRLAQRSTALHVRWANDDIHDRLRTANLRAQHRDLRYEAMLDHDIIVTQLRKEMHQPAYIDADPRTWAEAARLSRKRQLRRQNVTDVSQVDDRIQADLKRVKQETAEHRSTANEQPPNSRRNLITKEDVIHFLESRRTYNSLIY